jgi:hypothetical protein
MKVIIGDLEVSSRAHYILQCGDEIFKSISSKFNENLMLVFQWYEIVCKDFDGQNYCKTIFVNDCF